MLCAVHGSTAYVFQNGAWGAQPIEVTWLKGQFRQQMAQSLRIKDTIDYEARGRKLQWKKQPWSVFTEEGKELRPGTEAGNVEKRLKTQATVLLLLFEGGAWRWPTLRVGYEREVTQGVTLRTVARVPALFTVHIEREKLPRGSTLRPDLLSHVREMAQGRLQPSGLENTVDLKVRSSETVFLPYGTDKKLKELRRKTAEFLRAPAENLEDLQVLRYSAGQHYDAHRDYWDPREFPDVPRFTNEEGFWRQRQATLLWYLQAPEEGGETWFPRAHGGPIPTGEWTACDRRGELLSGRNTTAALFYSLRADGDIDEYSWHCGCEVKAGVKWAANSWMSNAPITGRRPPSRRPEL